MRARAAAQAAESTVVLTAHPKRRDWYAIPAAWAPEIAPAPSVGYDPKFGPLAHRSHLPLLAKNHPEVENFLAECRSRERLESNRSSDRANFDATTEPNGWKLRNYQHDGRDFIRERRGTLLADAMRVGKAQPLDAKVLTPSGWQLMGDLKVGDTVIDPDGGIAHITAVFPQGVRPVFRVTFCDGSATTCCDEHLWAVETPSGRHRGEPPSILMLRMLRNDLWAPAQGRTWGRGNRRFFIPLTKPVEFAASAPLSIAPYLLGALLGDGALTGNSVRLSNGGDEILDLIRPLLPAGVRIVNHGSNTYGLTVPDGGFDVGNPLLDVLRDLDLHGRDCFTKFIPPAYLRASIEDRLALLRGLMDTDGDVTEDCKVSFNTVSTALRDGVLELVRSLGGFASVNLKKSPTYTYRGERRVGAPCFRLHIRMPVNPFAMQRKALRWKAGNLARGFDSVEKIGSAECRCIAVDSKRNLYITDDYIVTHNTGQAISSHDPELGPMLVVAPLATREVWLSWFRRRWPDVRPVVLSGRTINKTDPRRPKRSRRDRGFDLLEGSRFDPQVLADAKLVFCNYDIVGAWKDLNGRRIGTLVFDEIHLVSQRVSRRAEAVTFISNIAERVIAATGTPIWNRPSGLFTTLSCVAPAAFGKFFDYAVRYCDAHPGAHGYIYDGASNEEEFRERMSEIMIRRTWQDVSGELPAIERAVEAVVISEDQQFQIEKEAERVRDHSKRTTAIGALARFRRLLAKHKIPHAVDVSRRILESGEKVVIWTWHRDVALKIEDKLAEAGFPGVVVSGDTAMNLREDLFDRWRNHPEPAPLVITLSVGQVGIDLSAARQTVFAELDFTPSVVAQAEMRTFSPLRPMAATYIIIDHEVDRTILAALQDKCDVAYRMGVPAAESTIGVLAAAFARITDGPDDFDALAKAIMLDHPDLDGDGDDDYHGALWDFDWEKGS